MGALLGFFAAGPARIQGLIIAFLAAVAVCLTLTAWALFERSGRLSAKVEVVTLKAQADVLADALTRCNTSIENAAKAGQEAVTETRRLVGLAERAFARTEALRGEIRGIVSKPTPTRPDGKPRDCTDALQEIRARVQP